MPEPGTPEYQSYLAAKKSIDDRSLNPRVWETLAGALPRGRRLEALELGAGIGSMVQRVMERGLLPWCRYTAVELEARNVEEAMRRLPAWVEGRGLEAEGADGRGFRARGEGVNFELSYKAADAVEFLGRGESRGRYDVAIAQAFLDLVDLEEVLPLIGASVKKGGLIYLCINFDGGTIFEPSLDRDLDYLVEKLYHRTMDERVARGKQSGDSRTGRRLFSELGKIGAELLDAGASDWVVFPIAGGYSAGEETFLHAIIDTVEGALRGRPELDPRALDHWTSTRRSQVERGELVYIAHQLDVLAQVR